MKIFRLHILIIPLYTLIIIAFIIGVNNIKTKLLEIKFYHSTINEVYLSPSGEYIVYHEVRNYGATDPFEDYLFISKTSEGFKNAHFLAGGRYIYNKIEWLNNDTLNIQYTKGKTDLDISKPVQTYNNIHINFHSS